jgi:capsular exopolysaccharide synthesis family protein
MSNLITLNDPHSPAAEAYQSLRTNIDFAGLDKPLNTLLVTAADDSADKSLALANLAVVMAQTGDRVIVVDGDLRRPRQHEIFGVSNQVGLSTWIGEDVEPPLQSSGVDNLLILPSGPLPANPVALLSNKQLGAKLEELSDQADFVVCDAPPVLAVTDAALWASKVDGVLLVVNAGSTQRDQAQRAQIVLQKVRAHLVGALLLNVDKETAMSGWEQD